MKVSFVIPARDERETLPSAVSSVSSQEGEFDKELIVVDGGSSDGTLSYAREVADKVVTGVKGRGNARDTGARQSSGDYIVFLDADTELRPSFTSTAIEMMEEKELSACTAKFEMTGLRSRVVQFICNQVLMRGQTPLLPGFAVAVKTGDYLESGGFSDVLGEDLEFSSTIESVGDSGVIRKKLVRTSGRRIASMGLTGTLVYYSLKELGRRRGVRESRIKDIRQSLTLSI
ncbi:MAG: glycosyltransferase [Candidatus Nanohaloarchaea archaeon]